MTHDEIVAALFGDRHQVRGIGPHLLAGPGTLRDGTSTQVIGIIDGEPLDGAGVLALADHVLDHIEHGGTAPIIVLVDTQGQRMSRHEEQLGLYEYLSHLAKTLLLASQSGQRTVGILYGQAAAGAFLATALATDALVCLGNAAPVVMDLPSMARVTKLPIEQLKQLSEKTPVFAPGVQPMVEMGAVTTVWDTGKPLDAQLEALLADLSGEDRRTVLGAERGGRKMARSLVERVIREALASVGD